MKKYIYVLILFLFGLSYTFASYDNCTEKEDGIKLCFNVENMGNGEYKFTTKFFIDTMESIPLKCELLTPDGFLKKMRQCKGEFSYDGNNKGELKIYTYIKDNRQLINIDYQFNNLSPAKLSIVKLVYNKFDLIKKRIEEKNSKILSDERWNNLSNIIKIQVGNFILGGNTIITDYNSFERLLVDYIKYGLLFK